ncbi:HAD family hydrolase [Sphingomonas ginkgonis]|uniref:HAD family hydrolase n=1 Tax=Sphingomonas ginkgonis TaxID=2315330 RepID=A0A3R9YKW6_9SPHN|nr:HAD family hydrolase [Sphingomonas ginkgonis]RST29841.1 HAD family hydrolase [Sphingomonas ginkgonis]
MSSRPLFVTDCDEVLLHMVTHFAGWLDEEHQVRFDLDNLDWGRALSRAGGEPLKAEEVWPLLNQFFQSEMHRQTLVPGAVEALGRIGEVADIIVLTNLGDHAHGWRVDQLAAHGIHHEVVCNQGGKGAPLRRLVERHGAGRSVFVDDLAMHHASVAEHSPETQRLHMIAEPKIAAIVPKAEHAHARIDDWATATPWILERLKDAA